MFYVSIFKTNFEIALGWLGRGSVMVGWVGSEFVWFGSVRIGWVGSGPEIGLGRIREGTRIESSETILSVLEFINPETRVPGTPGE